MFRAKYGAQNVENYYPKRNVAVEVQLGLSGSSQSGQAPVRSGAVRREDEHGDNPVRVLLRGVGLLLAGEIGQVRDMLGAVSSPGAAPGYHRTVGAAVAAATARPHPTPAKEG